MDATSAACVIRQLFRKHTTHIRELKDDLAITVQSFANYTLTSRRLPPKIFNQECQRLLKKHSDNPFLLSESSGLMNDRKAGKLELIYLTQAYLTVDSRQPERVLSLLRTAVEGTKRCWTIKCEILPVTASVHMLRRFLIRSGRDMESLFEHIGRAHLSALPWTGTYATQSKASSVAIPHAHKDREDSIGVTVGATIKHIMSHPTGTLMKGDRNGMALYPLYREDDPDFEPEEGVSYHTPAVALRTYLDRDLLRDNQEKLLGHLSEHLNKIDEVERKGSAAWSESNPSLNQHWEEYLKLTVPLINLAASSEWQEAFRLPPEWDSGSTAKEARFTLVNKSDLVPSTGVGQKSNFPIKLRNLMKQYFKKHDFHAEENGTFSRPEWREIVSS